MDRLKAGGAVVTAVLAVIGISAAVIVMTVNGTIEAETALAFLGPTFGGAATFLWNKQAAKDAADAALATPTNGGE